MFGRVIKGLKKHHSLDNVFSLYNENKFNESAMH